MKLHISDAVKEIAVALEDDTFKPSLPEPAGSFIFFIEINSVGLVHPLDEKGEMPCRAGVNNQMHSERQKTKSEDVNRKTFFILF